MEYPTVLFGPIFEHQHEDAFITEPPESLYVKNQVKPKPWLTGITKDEGEIFPLSKHDETLKKGILLKLYNFFKLSN